MFILNGSNSPLGRWIRDEVEFPGDVRPGDRGNNAKRVQEWLNLHGFGITIDSDFGHITKIAVGKFQNANGIGETGVVDAATFKQLVAPMTASLGSPGATATTLGNAMTAFAESHLKRHPREVGGQNRGPWVRLYMRGNEGSQWAWCAGFITFLLEQACEATGSRMPIKGSFSCDTLAAQAKVANLFLRESRANPQSIPEGSVFLVRRTSTDWTHTGIVSDAGSRSIRTIEGNTNDDGHREGYEVCARMRSYSGMDFVTIA